MSENDGRTFAYQMDCLSVQMRELLFRLAKGSLVNEKNGISGLKSLLDAIELLKKLPAALEQYFLDHENPGVRLDSIKPCIDEVETRTMRMMSPSAISDDGIMSFQLYRAIELIEYVHRAVQLIGSEEEKEDHHDEGTETQVDG